MTPRVIPTAAAVRDVPAKPGLPSPSYNLREKGKMREIERIIGKKFIAGEMPTGKQICEKQLLK